MEVIASSAGDGLNLASRKAQVAALRRFQATEWLESVVGPLGTPKQPSETEFINFLRNGLIAINEIEPGSVPKDNMVAGSSAKIVDCVLGLKEYNDRKQKKTFKHDFRPPLIMHPKSAMCLNKQLDFSANLEKKPPSQNDAQKLEDFIIKSLADCMADAKENLDRNLLSSICNGNTESVKLLRKMISSTLVEQLQNKFPKLNPISKDLSTEESGSITNSETSFSPNSSTTGITEHCQARDCNHWQVVQVQEEKLLNLKDLLSSTKAEFGNLQTQFQNDLKQMENQIKKLTADAQGYHKVVQENRSLYNMVQDLKGNIRVYCRIRPAFRSDTKNVIDYIGEDGSLVVLDPSKPNKDGKKLFQFNRVFGPTATQEEVFVDTQPLIRSVMDGYNVCIFAYGQTGSGKTHTMCGPTGALRKETGINYLALSDLFDLSNRRKDVLKYEIFVQMVEIYNEQVRDLLTGDSASSSELEIRSCTSENGLSLPDATIHSVKSTYDVLNLMKSGQVNRAVSSTALNHQSSRSHSILMVHVHGKDVNGGTIQSCLHLVDLAGSERVHKSEVNGEGLKEAQYINKSLFCLGDVITALSQKNSYIPYRNSKLTLLLQNSLVAGGKSKTLMFAHVSPEGDSFGETVSTLKFAQRASTVKLGAARLNKESREVMDLKEQIESLKKQLGEKEPQSAKQVNKLEPRSPFTRPKPAASMEPRSPLTRPKPASCTMMERTPKRPTAANSVLKNRQVKPLVLPKTPESQVSIRNEIKFSSEIRGSTTANGKSSPIRKSLQTIGKLWIPIKTNEVQSTTTTPLAIARPSRRQLLTGVQPPDRSRTSLGVDPCVDRNRNARKQPFNKNEVDVT